MAQVRFWDFTLNNPKATPKETREFLRTLAPHWAFQEETVSTRHYQGRIQRRKQSRVSELVTLCSGSALEGAHWTPTSTNGSKTMNYVMKVDSRTAGPWDDKQKEEVPLPKQLIPISKGLYPWQQIVWDTCVVFNARQINVVYDSIGNIGKSTLCQYMEYMKQAINIPPLNDFKECVQLVMGKGKCQAYTIDMPRAMKKDKLGDFWSFIEQLKSGHVWDTRYKYQEMWMDSPTIWVFTNTLPNFNLLSKDRWVLWQVENNKLIPYTPIAEVEMPPAKRQKIGEP